MPGLGVLPGRDPAAARRGEAAADAVEPAAPRAGPDHPLVAGLGAEPWVYFVHSYAAPGAAARRRRWWPPATTAGRWWPPWPPGRCGPPSSTPRSPAPPVWRCWPTSWPRRQAAERGALPGHRPAGRALRAAGGGRLRGGDGLRRRPGRRGRPPSPPPAPAGSTSSTSTRPGRAIPSTGRWSPGSRPRWRGRACGCRRAAGCATMDDAGELLDRRRGPGGGRDRGGGATRTWSAEMAARWPGRVAVGLDHRDGEVRVRGWTEGGRPAGGRSGAGGGGGRGGGGDRDRHLPRRAAGRSRRGRAGAAAGRHRARPIIASGGIRDLDDVRALARPRAGRGPSRARPSTRARLDLAAAPGRHARAAA